VTSEVAVGDTVEVTFGMGSANTAVLFFLEGEATAESRYAYAVSGGSELTVRAAVAGARSCRPGAQAAAAVDTEKSPALKGRTLSMTADAAV